MLEFFQTSGRNLLAAEAEAGVQHHIALSIAGADRMPDCGYFRAKVAQEQLIVASGIPLDDGTWKQLTGLAERLKVQTP